MSEGQGPSKALGRPVVPAFCRAWSGGGRLSHGAPAETRPPRLVPARSLAPRFKGLRRPLSPLVLSDLCVRGIWFDAGHKP